MIEEQLLEEMQKTNTLLMSILEIMEQGTLGTGNKKVPGGGRGYWTNLGQDEKDALEDEVNLEWWFMNYGEEALPAKYMHAFSATGQNVDTLYTKDEGDYIFQRLKDFLGEENEQGTHIFKYLGKTWCKREKNARNCFAFVPNKGK